MVIFHRYVSSPEGNILKENAADSMDTSFGFGMQGQPLVLHAPDATALRDWLSELNQTVQSLQEEETAQGNSRDPWSVSDLVHLGI